MMGGKEVKNGRGKEEVDGREGGREGEKGG